MTDVLVVGESLESLQVALDFAEVGLKVCIVREATERSSLESGGETVEGEVDTTGAIVALIERVSTPLGETVADDDNVRREPATAFRLLSAAGKPESQPTPHVWGIPTSPLAAQTAAILGAGRAIRVYMDRLTPLLTIGKIQSIGDLVRKRLGPHALRLLTAPIVRDRFGVEPAEVEVAVAAPGLNEALTRAGSLTGAALAYSLRYAERESLVAPREGWGALRDALLRRLELYSVKFVEGRVSELHEQTEERWRAKLSTGEEIDARAVVLSVEAPHIEGGARVAAAGTAAVAGASGGSNIDSLIDVSDLVSPHARLRADAVVGVAETRPEQPLLRTVGEWSLRVVEGEGVSLRGPRLPRGMVPQHNELEQTCAQILSESGIEAAPHLRWCFSVSAAPFISVAERDEAAQRLQGWTERHPSAIAVGRALHGDDLSVSIQSASARAVELRRRLLGITQD